MNKKILQLAIPSIISNITVPLLGLVDVAIVGHLGSAAYIGAIAVGGLLFNILYWSFGFLRMGTSGMTSQAYGRRDLDEVVRVLVRALCVGLFFAVALFLLRYPIEKIAFGLFDTSPEVQRLATVYFRICIWGAPAVLGLYGFVGWFIGMQNSRFPMFIAIVQNLLNIGFSFLFVFVFHMRVEGVALGTLLAQYGGLLMAIILWLHYYKKLRMRIRLIPSLQGKAMRRFFSVNGDIFFRTLSLIAVTAFFTSTGAKQGDVVLAVNTLLMQLFTLFSYIMDGFAYAGEALSGRYLGARNEQLFRRSVRLLFYWGAGLAFAFTLLYAVGGERFLSLLTDNPEVTKEATVYFYWVLFIPFAGFSAFLWDGICIGVTATRPMLYAMLLAMGSFFAVYFAFEAGMNNHALWMAFLVYLSFRGILLTGWYRFCWKMPV